MIITNKGDFRFAKSELSAALSEYVKAGRDYITKTGISSLENTNPEISRKGWRYIKEHVERDTHFRSVIETRINSLISNGYKIVPAQTVEKGRIKISDQDRMLANYVTECLERMEGCIETDVVAMMTHISRGMSLSEKNYRYLDTGKFKGKIGLKNIRFKEPELFSFSFDEFGYYKLHQVDPENKLLDVRKFVHMINGFNDENPYGESIAAMCAFWVWLKENGAKFWAIFQERFGMPIATLEVPDNIKDDPKAQAAADEITTTIHEISAIQIPKNMVLKFLEAMRSGEANYRGFLEFGNQEMSKVVLGSTLAVETQKNASGTHAAANTHENTMGKKLSFDVITSQAALNQQLIKPLIDFSFPGVERYPHFMWKSFDVSGFITLAQGIEALLRSGAKIPVSWLNELTTIPYPEGEEELLIYMPAVLPSEPKGVDNKTVNSAELIPIPISRPIRYAQTEDEKTAKSEDAENTRLINEGKAEIIRRWEGLAERIAESGKFDLQILSDFEQNEIGSIVGQFLFISFLRGVFSGNEEVSNILKDKQQSKSLKEWFSGIFSQISSFDREPGRQKFANEYLYQPFIQLLKDFKKRNLISKEEFDRLEKEFQRLAFTVTNNDTNYVLQKIHQELTEVLRGVNTLPDFYDQVIGVFERAGLVGKGNHIETVLRTNLQTQYIDGRERVFVQTDSTEFPYKQVVCVLDSATRPHHQKLHRYTKPVNDPIWMWLKPPFDYNCRCTLRLVHVSEKVEASDWVPDRGIYGLL